MTSIILYDTLHVYKTCVIFITQSDIQLFHQNLAETKLNHIRNSTSVANVWLKMSVDIDFIILGSVLLKIDVKFIHNYIFGKMTPEQLRRRI